MANRKESKKRRFVPNSFKLNGVLTVFLKFPKQLACRGSHGVDLVPRTSRIGYRMIFDFWLWAGTLALHD